MRPAPTLRSGNFLYVSLRALLDLEKEVITLAGDLGVGRFFPAVSPAQLLGIETNAYAHELAQTTVWIGYIQWLRENGFGTPSEPSLKRLDTIKQTDASLAGYYVDDALFRGRMPCKRALLGPREPTAGEQDAAGCLRDARA